MILQLLAIVATLLSIYLYPTRPVAGPVVGLFSAGLWLGFAATIAAWPMAAFNVAVAAMHVRAGLKASRR